jgi:hypothetical protein
MKNMLKGILFLAIAALLANFAAADSLEINLSEEGTYSTSSAYIKINQLKYEPYPVNPGEYFTLWIKAENIGRELAENAVFELVPEYPFSLDTNEDPVREYGKLSSAEPVVMEYKVRASKNAVEGMNEIELRYKTDSKDGSWIYEKFDIDIADAQTDFDMVIQEISDDEVSIAIANTGKNIAYSVIVRIPEQEYFQAVGTNGQMVGNLENGDYTLVGFEIARKGRISGDKLKVQIDYTDIIGERRSLIKELPFNTGTDIVINNIGNGNRTLPEGMTGEEMFARRKAMMQSQRSIYQQWWFWAVIAAVLFAGWKGYKFLKKKKEEKEEKKHKK